MTPMYEKACQLAEFIQIFKARYALGNSEHSLGDLEKVIFGRGRPLDWQDGFPLEVAIAETKPRTSGDILTLLLIARSKLDAIDAVPLDEPRTESPIPSDYDVLSRCIDGAISALVYLAGPGDCPIFDPYGIHWCRKHGPRLGGPNG